MNRGLIRKRWQVTIPKEVRLYLDLYIGQTLNWDVVHEEGRTEIRIFFGTYPMRGEGAAHEAVAARKARAERRQKRAASFFGKSAGNLTRRERRLAKILEGVLLGAGILPGEPEDGGDGGK